MAEVERMTIALTAEMADTVRKAVEAGDYASASEIVREALRDWSDKRLVRMKEIGELRAAIQEGLDDIETGRTIPLERARKVLRARYRKMQVRRAR